jgi:tRNA threonylcarbamoyl adenosine modification protein YeaZ
MSKKYILAVETLTNSGSLSLFSEQMDEIDVYVGREGNKLSADLIDMIRDLMNRNKIKPVQISTIIVVNGPGSFTGLRVGWSVVKGFAKALKISYRSVSLLDALFEQQIEKRTADYTFVSIGGGKIALKTSRVNAVEVFLTKEFLNCLKESSDKIFVTIESTYNLLQNELSETDNAFFASDNVSTLASKSVKKGFFDSNEIKYFG